MTTPKSRANKEIEYYKMLAVAVKETARREGITMRDLETRMGVSPGYFSRVAKGRSVPAWMLVQINRTLGIPGEDLTRPCSLRALLEIEPGARYYCVNNESEGVVCWVSDTHVLLHRDGDDTPTLRPIESFKRYWERII